MISLREGSWNVRLSSALPSLWDCRRKTAGRPCLQKLKTWDSWCWAKHWAEGVHCTCAILEVGEGPSPNPRSPLGQSLQPLEKFYQARTLGRIDEGAPSLSRTLRFSNIF